jgi:hypothetical protein
MINKMQNGNDKIDCHSNILIFEAKEITDLSK